MMNLLLDTCTFLWLAVNPARLSGAARELVSDRSNKLMLSSVSVWEIGVKYHLGRLPLPLSPAEFVRQARLLHGVDSTPLEEEDALQATRLPMHHRDPFDRLLIGQSIARGAILVSPDPLFAQYPVRTSW